MATKDSFDALVGIIKDKIEDFSGQTDQSHIQVIQSELRDRFDDLAKSRGYVSSDEYDALKILATRLEERITKLEELLKK